MRVLHLITGLGSGGAEGMLLKLLSVRAAGWESAVVSLGETGVIGAKVSELGVPVHALNLSRRLPSPVKLLSIVPLARRFSPQVIQGWMPHGNFTAVLAGMALRNRAPVLWNIRMSLNDSGSEPRRTEALIRMGARLSWYPARIVYNSEVGARQHETLGYRPAKTVIIPNGFDCEIFRPSEDARREIRAELGLGSDVILVGLIARYHPMKDHAGFLRAAATIARQYANVYFVLAGNGVTPREHRLMQSIVEEQLQDRVFLLGERSDVPRLTAALDIACSASARAEGFSNAVGEAMACAVPCVVTDIGDSRHVVSNTGLCVPARALEALAGAIGQLISLGTDRRRELGMAARQRVQKEFSLPVIAHRYEALYQSLLAPHS